MGTIPLLKTESVLSSLLCLGRPNKFHWKPWRLWPCSPENATSNCSRLSWCHVNMKLFIVTDGLRCVMSFADIVNFIELLTYFLKSS